MKIVAKLLIAILLSLFTANASYCQSNAPVQLPRTSINGSMDIKFNTRNGSGNTDVYTINSVNVCNAALFHGTVNASASSTGYVHDAPGMVKYSIDCDLVNQKNPSATPLNVGKLTGTVPVDVMNHYNFSDGDLTCSILQHGRAQAFDSKFSGTAIGKPPKKKLGYWASFKKQAQEAIQFTRKVNGKATSVTLKNYDIMEFRGHALATGPTQSYPEAMVNGTMYYDYNPRNTWFLRDIRVSYAEGGTEHTDILSGTVRWIEDKERDKNGLGYYEFDIRYNEPTTQAESAPFESIQDDAAFFETDNNVSSLTGRMNYRDTFGGKDQSVIASQVQFDLVGNKLTKQQAMYTAKLILFSAIVPWNAE